MIDLHLHTTASDGQHSAAEVVEMAGHMGLYAVSVADHNTVDAVAEAEAAAAGAGIEFAPCVELDTVWKGRDLHILGYFIDYKGSACAAYMERIFEAKLDQTRMRVSKLRELGFAVDYHELMRVSKGRLPAGKHYIAAMKARPENMNNPEFTKFVDGPRSDSPFLNFYLDWLKAGRPAFVPLEAQPAERVIEKIKELGGVPVLAHPSDTPGRDVHELIDAGLEGIEAYSSYHDRATAESFLRIAKDRGVLVTAGSDFHGIEVKRDVKLAGIPGNEDRLFDLLREAAGR